MSKTNGPSNPILRKLIRRLRKADKKTDNAVWTDLADRLSKSNRSRAEVNISRINRYTEEGSTVVVPGKVLGSGRLEHPLTVAAFDFSTRAKRRIQETGGETISIEELLSKRPEGENVRIME